MESNSNGLIYSTTTYLNALTENWHGIVVDDYAAVMAIPWKRKYGIRYAYIPPFTQQLGMIGDETIFNWKDVLNELENFILFADLNFNYGKISL